VGKVVGRGSIGVTAGAGAATGFTAGFVFAGLTFALAFTARAGFLAAMRLAFAFILRAGPARFLPLAAFLAAFLFFAMMVFLLVSATVRSCITR
jgi:hypothetical protein